MSKKTFWSFVVFLPQGEVEVREGSLILEKGQTGFNVVLDDVEKFVQKLESQGVRIIRKGRLDEYEPPQPEDLIEYETLQLEDLKNVFGQAESQVLAESLQADSLPDEEQGSSDPSRGGVSRSQDRD